MKKINFQTFCIDNEYRDAGVVQSGCDYELDIVPNSERIFSAVKIHKEDTHLRRIHFLFMRIVRAVSRRLFRGFYPRVAGFFSWKKEPKYVLVEGKIGTRSYKKILPVNESEDWTIFNDFANSWVDIYFNDVTKHDKLSLNISCLDGEQTKIKGRVDFLVSKPVSIPITKKPNIVLITMEALADIDFLYVKGWISDSTYEIYKKVFKRFTKLNDATCQTDWTFPATASYHTGLLASQHQLFDSERIKAGLDKLGSEFVTVAEMLKEKGYVTFSGHLGKLRPENGYSRGFDFYFQPSSSVGFIEYMADDKWVIRKLDQFQSNCYVHLHYDRTHTPYFSSFPGGSWVRAKHSDTAVVDENGQTKNMGDLYDNNLRLLLFDLDNVINYLEKTDQFDETLLIITSDHGSDLPPWPDLKQVDPLIELRSQIPYFINRPIANSKQRNATVRPIMDICDFLDIEPPEYLVDLPQFCPEFEGYAFSEAMLKSKNHQYVLQISDDAYTYHLQADLDYHTFEINKIVEERLIDRQAEKNINCEATLERFQDIRCKLLKANKEHFGVEKGAS